MTLNSIQIRDVTTLRLLTGAAAGTDLLGSLIQATATLPPAPLIVLDFQGIQLVTASFFRTAFREFRDYVVRNGDAAVVFANLPAQSVEDAAVLAEETSDCFLFADFEAGNLCNPVAVGRLEAKLAQTLKLVIQLEEADAKDISEAAREPTVTTAWSNRLAGLAKLGLVVDRKVGRSKRFRTTVEGMRYGN